MTEGLTPVSETESGASSERWSSPNRVVITSGDGKLRSVDVNLALRPVLTEQGQRIGQVLEVTLEANPGDKNASLDFVFKKDPQGNYQVLTAGWQSWSSSVVVGSLMADKMIGMKPFDKSLGGKTVPFFEPGPGGEKIPATEGRSYGWLGFRDLKGGENIALGVIPSLDSLEEIRYRQEGDNVVVSVGKNLEGVSSKRDITFKVFLGRGRPSHPAEASGKIRYADLVVAFSRELTKLSAGMSLMKDRVIGFSWPVYGPGVTQNDVQQEIAAGKGIIDTYVIDDGWETVSGSLKVNQGKFPNLPRLAKEMKDAGIKPGIWAAPFKTKEKPGGSVPNEWFMKDKQGKPMKLSLPRIGTLEGSYQLDVSVPEFRAYLADKFLELAQMGFEVFKVDFLAVPFTGKLQNTDKTSVEYYRQTFEEIRQRIREVLNKEIELIGCGAPMMESIGLFNGMRITPDSAFPLEKIPPIGGVISFINKLIPISHLIASKINTGMYKDAVAVAARRTLPFKGAHGLILDGIHINDISVPMDPARKARLNQSLLALNSLGIGNLFVGDSLVRIGEGARKTWATFIEQFKQAPKLEI